MQTQIEIEMAAYKSILQNLQQSMLIEQKKAIDARKKIEAEFLDNVKCSREMMGKIDAMYKRIESEYASEVAKLDVTFGHARKSRDDFIQSLRDKKLKASENVKVATQTLSNVRSMPLLKTCTSNVEGDVQSLLEDAMSQCEYIDTILQEFDPSYIEAAATDVPPETDKLAFEPPSSIPQSTLPVEKNTNTSNTSTPSQIFQDLAVPLLTYNPLPLRQLLPERDKWTALF